MFFELLFGLTILILFGAIALILYARWNYGSLDNLGFPVMKPCFLKGSVPDIHQKIQHFEDMERAKKYGPIWGLYQGRTPVIYISDPELIRQIYVKDSSHFYDREPFDLGNPYANEILDYIQGPKWKTMRVVQTRLFSSGKIKQYSNGAFQDCMDDFMNKLDNDFKSSRNKKLKIDARSRFSTFTVDAIARSMLSMKVEPIHDFYNACRKLMGEGQVITPFYIWTLVFPFLASWEPTLVVDNALIQTFKNVIAQRGASVSNRDDFGDVLKECTKKLNTAEYKKLDITETTLLAQATNLFLAGFDRISSTMTFLAYHLAKNTQIQTTLHEEIDSIVNDKYEGRIDYQTVADMPFLQACLSETLRMYPIFVRPERVCNKDWECPERGIKIKKGLTVMIASWAANRNPDIYEDPHEFKPERFLPENKSHLNSYAFTSFGFGHRSCFGMRFAYEALRISMCRVLHRYRFETRPDAELKFKPGIIMILQFEPLYLNVLER